MDYKAIIQAKRNLIDRKTNERRAEADQDAEELRILEAMEAGQSLLDNIERMKLDLEVKTNEQEKRYRDATYRLNQTDTAFKDIATEYQKKKADLEAQLTPLLKAVENAKQELADTHGKIEQLSKQHADLVKQHKAEIDKIKADFDEWKRVHRL